MRILIVMVLALSVVACAAEDYLSPEQGIVLAQHDAQIEVLQEELVAVSAAATDADATPAELVAVEAAGEALVAKVEEREAFVDSATIERVGMVSTLLGAFGVPAVPQWLDLLGVPLLGAFRKRPQQNMLAGLKAGLGGDLKGLAKGVMSAIGHTHTSEDPMLLAKVAQRKALLAGDTNLAQRLGNAIPDTV